MKRKAGILILGFGFAALMSGSACFALGNNTNSYEFSEQSCGVSDNRICDAMTNDLMKELIKQTVYTVGTQMLNKLNQANTTTAVPVYYSPAQPVTTTPTYYTPAPVTTATTTVPVQTPAVQTTTAPQEQMIIIQ